MFAEGLGDAGGLAAVPVNTRLRLQCYVVGMLFFTQGELNSIAGQLAQRGYGQVAASSSANQLFFDVTNVIGKPNIQTVIADFTNAVSAVTWPRWAAGVSYAVLQSPRNDVRPAPVGQSPAPGQAGSVVSYGGGYNGEGMLLQNAGVGTVGISVVAAALAGVFIVLIASR